MKRRTVNSLLGFVVPLVLTAVLILGWRAPLFLRGGGEMMYFLLAVAMGYPVLGVFCGIVGVRSGFVGKWLAVPFMAALGAGFVGSTDELRTCWRLDRAYEPKMSADEREFLLSGWHRAVERCRGWAK